jgi:hypothetical protein
LVREADTGDGSRRSKLIRRSDDWKKEPEIISKSDSGEDVVRILIERKKGGQERG